MYIKAGSIIPIKLHGNKRHSLIEAFDDPIRLDIYLDKLGEAKGLLYLDDGDTFKYDTDNESMLIEFSFRNRSLWFKNLKKDCIFEQTYISITQVNLYGVGASNPAYFDPDTLKV
jgi:alpha-glucosidase (family GH31 glycosyl hydrolase)